MKKLFIIVLHYRDLQSTKQAVTSLMECILPKDALRYIVVVDNNSSEQYVLDGAEKKAGVLLQKNSENLGYAGGNNAGIQFAIEKGADYIVVLNNDTIVDKKLLTVLCDTLSQNPNIGIVVPKIYFYPGTEFHYDRYKKEERGKVIWYAGGIIDWKNVLASHEGVDQVDTGQFYKAKETAFATGCCIAFSREVFLKVGGFDEKYFLYLEDIDLSMRVKQAGYKVLFEPSGILWHKNAKSSGGSGSILQDYYISRNRLLFGMRYAPLRARISLVRESMRLLLGGRKWQKNGIKDFYLHRFYKGTFPIR